MLAAVAAGVSLISAGHASAASTETWTGSVGSTDWVTPGNWSGTNKPPASLDSLIFTSANASSSATLTNTLTGSSFNIASITFNAASPAYVMTGNTFNLTAGMTNSSTSLETFSNTGGLNTSSATETFTLTSGSITITNGLTNTLAGAQTLAVNGAANTLTIGGYTLENNGTTLRTDIINGSGNVNINASVVDGTGVGSGLTYSGTGSLTLSAANSYTGSTTVSNGTLIAANVGALGASGNTLNMSAASTFRLATDTGFGSSTHNINVNGTGPYTTNVVVDRATSGSGAGIIHNFGTLTLVPATGNPVTFNVSQGSNVTSGTETLAFATVTFGNTGSAGPENVVPVGVNLSFGNVSTKASTANEAQTLVLDGTSTGNVITGAISNNVGSFTNTAGITKQNSSTWVLSGTSTYTGITTVNGGTLQLSGANGENNGTTPYVLTGGSFIVDNTTANGGNNNARIADTSTISLGGGALVYNGADAASTNSTESVGAITGAGNSTVTVAFGGTNLATLTAASFGHTAGNSTDLVNGLNLGQNSSGAASQGRFIITTAPTLVGTTVALATGINAGILTTKIVPFLVGEATPTTGGLGTATGTANTFLTYIAATGLRPLNPTDEFANNIITATDNTYITSATTAAASAAINSLVISGGDLSINPAFTLTDTSGALLFVSSNAIKPSSGTTSVLAFAGVEPQVTVNPGVTATISANITGTIGLTKSGQGSLVLAGANTFSGAVNLNAGITSFTGSMGSTATTVNVNNAAILRLGSSTGLNVNDAVATGSAATSMIQLLGNNITLASLNTATIAGTPIVENNNGGSAVSNATLTFNGAAGSTFAGLIQDGAGGGTLALQWNSSGQLALSGANTYTGGTTITSGSAVPQTSSAGSAGNPTSGAFGAGTAPLVLAAGGSMRPTTSASITVGNNVTVSGDFTFITATPAETSLTFTAPLTLSGGTHTLTVNIGQTTIGKDLTFSGPIGDGNGGTTGNGLNVTGAGYSIFSGAGTYSGTTTLSGQNLRLSNVAATSATGTGPVNLTAGTSTLSGTGFSSGLLTITGGGIVAPGVNNSTGSNKFNFGTVGTLSLGTAAPVTGGLSGPIAGGITATNAAFDFDLSASSSAAGGANNDLITTAGPLTLGTLAFNFSETTLLTGPAYTLISGATGVAGFDPTNITTTFVAGQTYTPTYSIDGSNDLQVTFSATPEPASLALLAMGTTGLLMRRRRR